MILHTGKLLSSCVLFACCLFLLLSGCYGTESLFTTIQTIATSEDGTLPSEDASGPADVSNLQAVPGDGEVVLTWNDPADADLDHVEITWTPDGSIAQTVEAGIETYTAGGFTNGTAYTFTVMTVDTNSNPSSGTNVSAAPGANAITFLVDLPEQPTITFSGQQLSLAYGTDMTVTIVVSEQDSVTWYLDGVAIHTGLSTTLGSTLGTGPYGLTAVVRIDDAYYS